MAHASSTLLPVLIAGKFQASLEASAIASALHPKMPAAQAGCRTLFGGEGVLMGSVNPENGCR